MDRERTSNSNLNGVLTKGAARETALRLQTQFFFFYFSFLCCFVPQIFTVAPGTLVRSSAQCSDHPFWAGIQLPDVFYFQFFFFFPGCAMSSFSSIFFFFLCFVCGVLRSS